MKDVMTVDDVLLKMLNLPFDCIARQYLLSNRGPDT